MTQNASAEITSSPAGLVHGLSGLSAARVSELEELACLGQAYREVRLSAFNALLKTPFPTSRFELWRQTRPELFNWEAFSRTEGVLFGLCCLGGEGCTGKEDQGFTLHQGLAGAGKWLNAVLSENSDFKTDAVSALQLAAVSGACILEVPRNSEVKRPIVLSQRTAIGAHAAPLILVVLEQGAKCTLVEDLDFLGNGLYAPRIEVIMGEGSSLDFYSVQRMAEEAQYLGRHRFHVGRDASLRTFHAFLGGAVSRLDLDCRMTGPGGSAELNSVYIASGSRHVDYHPIQEHIVDHCSSNLFCKGALKGESRGVYYGLIRVSEGADKTDAYQKNRNLLLSPESRVDAVPNLEIRANDVKCSHGATVGQVGSEEMFYLMSRGLSRDEAEKLLVEGFFEDALSRIKIEKLHDLVSELVLERLHG